MDLKEFLLWEQATRDCIDVKKIYVDMADDLVAGVLLSQIVYWNLPDKQGKTKLRVVKDGHLWLAKGRENWWDECRIKPRQFDTAFKKLEEQGLVEKKTFKFNGDPTLHIRILWDKFLPRLQELLYQLEVAAAVSAEEEANAKTLENTGFYKSVKTELHVQTVGNTGFHESVKTESQIRENEVTNPLIPLTENSNIDLKNDREIGSQAKALAASDEETEYLILETLVEQFFPRDSVRGNLNRVVLAKDIWRYWKSKHPDLTIYHMYAVLDMVEQSPGSTQYDATSIICKQMAIAQTLLVPVKKEAMNKIHTLKQTLQQRSAV